MRIGQRELLSRSLNDIPDFRKRVTAAQARLNTACGGLNTRPTPYMVQTLAFGNCLSFKDGEPNSML
jgi:hypothetical protein